jgi:hypothetical protein
MYRHLFECDQQAANEARQQLILHSILYMVPQLLIKEENVEEDEEENDK